MNTVVRLLAISIISVAFATLSSAWAHTTYTQVDYPGAVLTEIAGGPNLEGTSVGAYSLTAGGALHGFALNAHGVFTPIDVPGATSTIPNFINLEGVIVGSYTDSAGTSHGFVLNARTYTTVDYPDEPGTELTGINDLVRCQEPTVVMLRAIPPQLSIALYCPGAVSSPPSIRPEQPEASPAP